jgi:hypothetical protein
MADDEIKKLILARRAQFIAAAVAGFVACEPGPEAQPPNVCLSIAVPPPDDGSVGPTIVDAGVSIDPDAAWANDATVATEPDSDAPPQPCLAPPMPCLSVVPPPPRQLDAGGPPPRPCLSPKPPRPPPTASTKPPPPRICLSFSGPDE